MAKASKLRPYRFASMKVIYNAVSDARCGLPLVDDKDYGQYEKELISRTESYVNYIQEKWYEKDEELKSRYCQLKQKLERLKKDVIEHEARVGELENVYAKAKNNLAERETIYPRTHWYWVIIAIIAILEFPINRIVFDIFAENKLFTTLAALIISAITVFSAHMLGQALKQREGSSVNITKTIISAVTIAFVFIFLGSIAYIRESYFKESIKLLGLDINLNMIILFFFSINTLFLLIALWISYTAHPRDPDKYHKLTDAYNRASKDLEEANIEYIYIKNRIGAVTDEIKSLEVIRDKTHARAMAKVAQVCNTAQAFIRKYRKTNLKWRKDNKNIESFKAEPAFEIPDGLRDMDWDCEKQAQSVNAAYELENVS